MSDLTSDKHYWHRYTDTHEEALRGLGHVGDVLEIGVLRGRSIAWLSERLPQARILGVDILAQTPEWPTSERTNYVQLDQGDRVGLRKMFAEFGRLHMYRRSSLPLRCYGCGRDLFDYARWRCQCGVELFSSTDSMSFLVYRAEEDRA